MLVSATDYTQAFGASYDDTEDLDLSKLSFLVVDDQATARTALRAIVGQLGATKIEPCDSIFDALYQIEKNGKRYDVILSDYILGGQRDGQQFLEEARRRKLIPTRTVFIMVTGETSYTQVVSAAELTPDDYLIKPFTADTLRGRLLKAIARKSTLAPILSAIENHEFDRAIRLARDMRGDYPKYAVEITRLEAESLLACGRDEEAITLTSAILGRRMVPWAKLVQARAHLALNRLEQANHSVSELMMEAPDYIAALDLKARVLAATGHHSEAQRTLEKALHKNPKMLPRRRAHGKTALRNNDYVAAEQSFSALLQHGFGSTFVESEDFANCAVSAVRNGNPARALEVIRRAKEEVPNDPNLHVHTALVEIEAYSATGSQELRAQAYTKLTKAIDHADLSPELKLEAAKIAFRQGDEELAKKLGAELAFQQQGDEASLDEVRKLFDANGMGDVGKSVINNAKREIVELNNKAVILARQKSLRESVDLLLSVAMRNHAPPLVILNAVAAIVSLTQQQGPEERLLDTATRLFSRAEKLDPANPKLEKLRSSLAVYGRS